MKLRKLLGRFVFFALLQISVFAGAPVTPEKIEELMKMTNQARIVEMQRTDEE